VTRVHVWVVWGDFPRTREMTPWSRVTPPEGITPEQAEEFESWCPLKIHVETTEEGQTSDGDPRP